MTQAARTALSVGVSAALSVLVVGCAPGSPAAGAAGAAGAAPSPSPVPSRVGFVRKPPAIRTVYPARSATATVPSVAVHTAPDGPVRLGLANPQPSGAPLVFLVVSRRGDWVEVQLPVRPNGSTGWVRAGDVTLAGVAYRLDVQRSEHRLLVYRFGTLLHTYPVGIGTTATPTPGGTFYLKELLKPPTADGPYGPFAYGLSGFSNTLTSFDGGDGVIGIHGTDHPELVGTDVSHGCIRLRNADITVLAHELPLGTPVRILT